MSPLRRILAFALLALAVKAATTNIVPPASQGVPGSADNTLDLNGTKTDTNTIVSTVNDVNQKAGATGDAPPNQAVPETNVTAIDGQVLDATVSQVTSSDSTTRRSLKRRDTDGYHQIFAGTGPAGGSANDAAIEGTAYLTYTVVPNSTYNIDACLAFCTSVEGCVFANLYYEFNNELLDFVFGEHSNLKCAVYADIHTAAEKTNSGGQQSYPSPGPLTYIQDSSGWGLSSLADPSDPDGYELVFGPTNGANNAPGYMGFSFLDRYDVDACAALCNARDADSNGGACQYFNIWRAVVSGIPTTYTCSFYYIVTDASTAVNYGQGNLQVTYSRGYSRKDYVVDGGFEGYTCGGFCYTASYTNWIGTSPAGGYLDASIFHYQPYSHSGSSVGLLGSANGADALPGTLAPAAALATVSGKQYTLTFFHISAFSGPTGEQDAFVQIVWNGAVVATITPGYSPWTYYSFTLTAVGSDHLAFKGGKAPAWSFIDDVHVFLH